MDNCYNKYLEKAKLKNPERKSSLASFDALLFHSPYCKLVQKSFARLAFVDFLNTPKDKLTEIYKDVMKFHNVKTEDSYFDRDIEKAFLTISDKDFRAKTQPSLLIANQVGNMYTPSVYSGLVSLLINRKIEDLAGCRVGVFSYGSGLASSMYSITISKDLGQDSALRKLVEKLSYVKTQLDARKSVDPIDYTKILASRETNCHSAPFVPKSSIEQMFPGTYYLQEIDDKHRRTYKRSNSAE